MARFRFEAVAYDGQTEKGTVDGDSLRAARQQLLDKGLVPVKVELESEVTQKSGLAGLFSSRRAISPADLAVVTKQFALLVRSGLPMDDALKLLADESPKATTRQVLMAMVEELHSGVPLSKAMKTQAATFDSLFQSVVAAAEQSGLMGQVLTQYAEFLEKRQANRQKVIAAMVYPVMLIGVSFLVMTVLMVYVIPQVTRVFQSTRQKLPAMTEIVMSISGFLTQWGWALLIGALLTAWIIRQWLKRPAARLAFDSRCISLPLIGPVLLAQNTARFANTMAMLVGANVPILSALKSARTTLANTYMQAAIESTEMQVREGTSLSRALGAQGVFSPLFVHMLRSGEATGQLAEMLKFGAENAEFESDKTTRMFTSVLEPVMILFMGMMVLVIVMAVMQPILEMNSGIR
ncbi:MAG TPA: type II secretion system protein GspF [Alcaligenaceae bacterium]|nr:type II secretion system protein GspF [Alcaligenaceae bacterium]